MAQIFAAFGKFNQNNKGSVQNFGIIGVTIGAEEMTKFIFFYCPCNYPMNQVYGTTFIWGPAAILLVVGYVVNRTTWRLMTGMCNRTQGVGRGGKRIVHFIFIFAKITMKAVIAPATWVVISFLKGDYFTCASWPGPNDPGAAAKFNLGVNATIPPPCYYKEKPIYFKSTVSAEVIARDLRAYSHIIGWWFLSYTVLIGIFFVFVFRCLSKYSYEQSKYIEKYRDAEMKLFEEALDAKAQAQAKIIVDQFFTKPRSKEEWDQIAAINDKVMKSKRGRPIYSPLHKFSNKELVALELAQDDIVTNAAQKKRHLSNILLKKKPGSKSPTATAAKSTAAAKPQQSPAVTMMPMVTMPSTQKVRIKQHPPGHPANPNPTPQQAPSKPAEKQEAAKEKPETTNPSTDEPKATTTAVPTSTPQVTEAEVETPGVQQTSRPHSLARSEDDDPILETNAPDRSSLVIPMDDNVDPILEANVTEQADEIRKSMQDLTELDQEVVEATEDEIGDQAPYGDDDDSEPLL